MAFKGTAGKSASGASMSKYDVEVEARLKKLEAHTHDAPAVGGDEELAKKVDYLFKHLGLTW
tara:strand:- start:37 stop:222 length:186 start_codon:yes stop_codon:yes gene_type:complete